jgi:hypothetical protein
VLLRSMAIKIFWHSIQECGIGHVPTDLVDYSKSENIWFQDTHFSCSDHLISAISNLSIFHSIYKRQGSSRTHRPAVVWIEPTWSGVDSITSLLDDEVHRTRHRVDYCIDYISLQTLPPIHEDLQQVSQDGTIGSDLHQPCYVVLNSSESTERYNSGIHGTCISLTNL